ncbi:14597_t:CDS:2 [Ambispora leptoticha]|uniref:14597_t:CDS:1 n=1 Tax=Ambispora leptoticha TaxID=144679 RepID=A0A9N8YNJ4_9GLOM|nr:14597_t:CDS:2 [Ambispora leptoticha]
MSQNKEKKNKSADNLKNNKKRSLEDDFHVLANVSEKKKKGKEVKDIIKNASNDVSMDDDIWGDDTHDNVSVGDDDTETSDESDEDNEFKILNVDAEFFDPQPSDFLAIKNLLTQLFSADSVLFNLSELTELIINQPLLGTTVKLEGSESDPFALLTVLNVNVHQSKPCMKTLINYILEKTDPNKQLYEKLSSAILKNNDNDNNSNSNNEHVGLILSERLLNMPVQIVPPMYKMLMEEIQWAVDDDEPYNFEWYLIITKTYREVASSLDEELIDDISTLNNNNIHLHNTSASNHVPNPKKKKKKTKSSEELQTFYFHPEDEIIEQNAEYTHDFKLTKQLPTSDSRRAFQDFGVAPAMKVFLLHRDKIQKLITDLEVACQ